MDKRESRANQCADFLRAIAPGEVPGLRLPHPDHRDGETVMVLAYWREGELVVSVDTDDAPDRVIPVRLAVNDDRGAYRTEVRP